MIKEKEQGILIVISGPSGVGKGTICKNLEKKKDNLWVSISATTRKPRSGEKDGIDYFFITKKEFEDKIKKNEMLEYAKVHHGEYYGTPKFPIQHKLNEGIDVVLEIDIEGALQIKEHFKESLFIFILPPSMRELKHRLIKRGTEDSDKMMQRFQKAYQEINALTKYNYVVVNDCLKDAVDKIIAILLAERCRVDRIEDLYLNSIEEEIHELLVDKDLENDPFKIE